MQPGQHAPALRCCQHSTPAPGSCRMTCEARMRRRLSAQPPADVLWGSALPVQPSMQGRCLALAAGGPVRVQGPHPTRGHWCWALEALGWTGPVSQGGTGARSRRCKIYQPVWGSDPDPHKPGQATALLPSSLLTTCPRQPAPRLAACQCASTRACSLGPCVSQQSRRSRVALTPA